MSWFFLSLVHALLLSVVWLSFKKSQDRGFSGESVLFLYSIVLVAGVLVWSLFRGEPLVFPPLFWTMLLFIAGGAAGLSNLLLLYSFKQGPNPGLSLALSDTKVLWMTLIGFFFLGSALSFGTLSGVLAVLLGVWLMYVGSRVIGFGWGLLALFASLAATAYWVFIKLSQAALLDLDILAVLILVFLPQIIVIYIFRRNKLQFPEIFKQPTFLILAVTGLVGALSNFVSIKAVLAAPNPGYPLAVSAASIIVTLAASWVFFGDRPNRRQALAALIIFLAIVTIRLTS